MIKRFRLFHKVETPSVKDNNMMDNVLNSMFNSKPLYDALKVKCHPDKFMDKTRKAKAEVLFRELQACKHDIQKMKELKVKIDNLCESNYGHQ